MFSGLLSISAHAMLIAITPIQISPFRARFLPYLFDAVSSVALGARHAVCRADIVPLASLLQLALFDNKPA